MLSKYNIKEKDFSIDMIFLMNKLRLVSITLDQVSEGIIPLPEPGGGLSKEEKQELEYNNPVVGATQIIDEITDDLKVIHKALYL